MKRSPMPPRTARLPRSGIKRKPRPAAEKRRIYGTAERISWLKALGCIVCSASPCDVAHVETGGMGRKSDADRTGPLCRPCHRCYDEHRAPFNDKEMREFVKWSATRIEALWQSRSGGPEHISSIVTRVMEKL